MPKQEYKQPARRPKDDYWPDEPTSPLGHVRKPSPGVSDEQVGQTLENIDDAIAEHEKLAASAPPPANFAAKKVMPEDLTKAEMRDYYNRGVVNKT
ncbi:hypothetical protein IRY61_04060, partial [Candidatus Saccharibacteria bacterium]|nr:hypothetical protein [Candidatus Saccharibacteria bacterium]